MNIKKIFVCIIVMIIFQSSTFAKNSEAIFIEAISELNKGIFTINEVRTRPTEFSADAKKISIEADGYYIAEGILKENSYVA